MTAILNSAKVFHDPEGKLNVFIPRVVFCLIQAVGLLFAVYRVNTMGLLPTHASDWISILKAPVVKERLAALKI